MEFQLPEIYEIETTVDGRQISGSYAFVLGLTVYYKGYAENVSKPAREEDVPIVARQILAELVRQREGEMGQVPAELPPVIQEAASNFLDSFDDEEPIHQLIQAFGETEVGSHSHRQVSFLLVNLLTPIVPFWTEMCDDDLPVRTHGELRALLSQENWPNVDWQQLETVAVARRDGEIIGDCDACRVEPMAEAVASCAKFMHTGEQAHAVDCISNAIYATSEGCWVNEHRFERWLVEVALRRSLACELI